MIALLLILAGIFIGGASFTIGALYNACRTGGTVDLQERLRAYETPSVHVRLVADAGPFIDAMGKIGAAAQEIGR